LGLLFYPVWRLSAIFIFATLTLFLFFPIHCFRAFSFHFPIYFHTEPAWPIFSCTKAFLSRKKCVTPSGVFPAVFVLYGCYISSDDIVAFSSLVICFVLTRCHCHQGEQALWVIFMYSIRGPQRGKYLMRSFKIIGA
jgi:hypothetical protein